MLPDLEPDTVMLPLEPDTDFWIVITNVHEKSCCEALIRVLFEKCGKVRSQFFEFDSNDYFRGSIYVAYGRREEANEAVNLYQNNITLFGKTWRLQLMNKRKRTRLIDAASASSTRSEFCDADSSSSHSRSTRFVDAASASSTRSEFCDADASSSHSLAAGSVEPSILSDAVRTLSLQDDAAGVGVSAKVLISNIDARVPNEFIELLFEKTGRLRSYTVYTDSSGQLPGTAQVVYEEIEDSIAAVNHFTNNVAFFGRTWGIQLDIAQLSGINDQSSGKGKQKVQ